MHVCMVMSCMPIYLLALINEGISGSATYHRAPRSVGDLMSRDVESSPSGLNGRIRNRYKPAWQLLSEVLEVV
jgi:hypothetical protein